MNRFNKTILFGLVAAIFGATSVRGVEIEKNFEVVSSNTSGAKQSISIDGKNKELAALSGEKIADALASATEKTKVTYCYGYAQIEKNKVEELSDANKMRVATVYACWLIKVKDMASSNAFKQATKKVGISDEAIKAIVEEFYKKELNSVDFTQFIPAASSATAATNAQPSWSVWKKIKALTLFGLMLTAGAGLAHKYAPSYDAYNPVALYGEPMLQQLKAYGQEYWNRNPVNVTNDNGTCNATNLYATNDNGTCNATDLNSEIQPVQAETWISQFMNGLRKTSGYGQSK